MFSSPLFLAFRRPWAFIVAFFSAASLFLIQYYLMATLPGTKNLSCVMGAWLTFGNLVFSLFVSLLFGFLVPVFIFIFSQSLKTLKSAASTSGVFSLLGFGTSMLSVFCTFCTLPVISFFGVSIGLSIFTFYNAYFKVLSIIFLFISIFLLHRKLQKGCKFR
ncbi:hypothetical protein HYV56_00550 [Candidatus Peregrinibacteria bacterium]|nr:hypothetical protein [Candidatus Peregrinibacteria bacterium]